jgi:hypothetical protein
MDGAGDIFGENSSRLGTGHSASEANDTPKYRTEIDENGKPKRVRNTELGGILHTYTDEKGSARTDIPLYTLGGWTSVTNYYEGGNSGLIFNYAGGITIEFVHVGTDNKNKYPSIPKNPGNGKLQKIGFIGGYGGVSSSVYSQGISYNHTHIVFFSNKAKGIRIDPRKIFCGW